MESNGAGAKWDRECSEENKIGNKMESNGAGAKWVLGKTILRNWHLNEKEESDTKRTVERVLLEEKSTYKGPVVESEADFQVWQTVIDLTLLV